VALQVCAWASAAAPVGSGGRSEWQSVRAVTVAWVSGAVIMFRCLDLGTGSFFCFSFTLLTERVKVERGGRCDTEKGNTIRRCSIEPRRGAFYPNLPICWVITVEWLVCHRFVAPGCFATSYRFGSLGLLGSAREGNPAAPCCSRVLWVRCVREAPSFLPFLRPSLLCIYFFTLACGFICGYRKSPSSTRRPARRRGLCSIVSYRLPLSSVSRNCEWNGRLATFLFPTAIPEWFHCAVLGQNSSLVSPSSP